MVPGRPTFFKYLVYWPFWYGPFWYWAFLTLFLWYNVLAYSSLWRRCYQFTTCHVSVECLHCNTFWKISTIISIATSPRTYWFIYVHWRNKLSVLYCNLINNLNFIHLVRINIGGLRPSCSYHVETWCYVGGTLYQGGSNTTSNTMYNSNM